MERLIAFGILLIFVGVVVLFAGVLTSVHRGASQESEVKAGGVILIGPIPVIFGSDKTMILISILGAILFLLAYLAWRR